MRSIRQMLLVISTVSIPVYVCKKILACSRSHSRVREVGGQTRPDFPATSGSVPLVWGTDMKRIIHRSKEIGRL